MITNLKTPNPETETRSETEPKPNPVLKKLEPDSKPNLDQTRNQIPTDPGKLTLSLYEDLPEAVKAALSINEKQLRIWDNQRELINLFERINVKKEFTTDKVILMQYNDTGTCWERKQIQETLRYMVADEILEFSAQGKTYKIIRGKKS